MSHTVSILGGNFTTLNRKQSGLSQLVLKPLIRRIYGHFLYHKTRFIQSYGHASMCKVWPWNSDW